MLPSTLLNMVYDQENPFTNKDSQSLLLKIQCSVLQGDKMHGSFHPPDKDEESSQEQKLN